MPVYNYKKEYDISNDKYPVNTHLCIETSVGIYFVDNADRTKVYSLDVSDGTSAQVDVDPDNDSGDQKSRLQDIIAAWHDRSDEKIWFVECDNSGSSFEVFYLDYSGGLGSETTSDVDSESITAVTVIDIFKISTKFYVLCHAEGSAYTYDVTSSPFVLKASLATEKYGFFGGGLAAANSNIIGYTNLTTTSGNNSDKGDLTQARRYVAGIPGEVLSFFGGGYTSVYVNTIDYVEALRETGNAVDKGDMTATRGLNSSCVGATYGFCVGDNVASTLIDGLDITTTTGDAFDKGDLTVSRAGAAGVSGSAYGFFGGGISGASQKNEIDYIDITTTTGNATDSGDLTVARYYLGGTSGSAYGFFGGGARIGISLRNEVDYIDITTTGNNATDKGDLTVARYELTGTSGSTYGFYGGGYTTGRVNVVDYIDITTTSGNATDKGDLQDARWMLGGA